MLDRHRTTSRGADVHPACTVNSRRTRDVRVGYELSIDTTDGSSSRSLATDALPPVGR
jgi:hypothetical protein